MGSASPEKTPCRVVCTRVRGSIAVCRDRCFFRPRVDGLYCRARNVLQQYRLCGLIGSNFSGPLRGGGHDDLHRPASASDTTRPSHSPPTASASVSPVIQSPCCPPKYYVCAGDERKRFIRLVRTSGAKKKKQYRMHFC